MGLTDKDMVDMKLARPVAVVDLWEVDDRVDRLEAMLERLEKVVHVLINHYHQERARDWELILREMLKDMDRTDGDKTRIRTR